MLYPQRRRFPRRDMDNFHFTLISDFVSGLNFRAVKGQQAPLDAAPTYILFLTIVSSYLHTSSKVAPDTSRRNPRNGSSAYSFQPTAERFRRSGKLPPRRVSATRGSHVNWWHDMVN